jgi:hypothetical protein
MKKQIILFILLIAHLSSLSQKSIKTQVACNDSLCRNVTGRWIKTNNVFQTEHIGFNQLQVNEVVKRLDTIHKMVTAIIPEPKGVDAAWHHSLGYGTFANRVKYYMNDNKPTYDIVKENPLAAFYYSVGFFGYNCGREPNEMWTGYPGETGTWVNVFANSLSQVATTGLTDTMTVNGLEVKMKNPVLEKREGYELLYAPGGGNKKYVLLHRKDMLPYLPVTRKQYLDYCINYLDKFYNEMIMYYENLPAGTQTEKQERDE